MVLPAIDIVEGRVEHPEPPSWSERRGWTEFLLGLPDALVARCEAEGLMACATELPGCPDSLLELAQRAAQAVELAALSPHETSTGDGRWVKQRKRAQLAALVGAVQRLAVGRARVVDVGAGAGHFVRLAAELVPTEVLGVERNGALVERGTRHLQDWQERRPARGGHARLEHAEIGVDGVALQEGDLAVGIHACGELGDRLVTSAARAGAALALVSCCLQKVSATERRPLSERGGELLVSRSALGLTNVTARPDGVETSLEANLRAREARYALRRLLAARGLELVPGAEMQGINRRQAHAGFAELARLAAERRRLPPPTAAELASHAAAAQREFAAIRRFWLVRTLLARPLELAIIFDRAAFLEERGFSVEVARFCEPSVTPRNVVVLASRQG